MLAPFFCSHFYFASCLALTQEDEVLSLNFTCKIRIGRLLLRPGEAAVNKLNNRAIYGLSKLEMWAAIQRAEMIRQLIVHLF